MKPKIKFKVGDKVRILPSAIGVGVFSEEVGKQGIINIPPDKSGWFAKVFMDEPCTIRNETCRRSWNVNSSQIELVITPRQQLLFWDDMWEIR